MPSLRAAFLGLALLGCAPADTANVSTEGRQFAVVARTQADGALADASLHRSEGPVRVLVDPARESLVVLSFSDEDLEAFVRNLDRSRLTELSLEIAEPPAEPTPIPAEMGLRTFAAIPPAARVDVLVAKDGAPHFERGDAEGDQIRAGVRLVVPTAVLGECSDRPQVELAPFEILFNGTPPMIRAGDDILVVVGLNSVDVVRRGVGTSTRAFGATLHVPRPGYQSRLVRVARDPSRSDLERTTMWVLACEALPTESECQADAPGSVIEIEVGSEGALRVVAKVPVEFANAHLVVTSGGEPWVLRDGGRSLHITGDPPVALPGPRFAGDHINSVGPMLDDPDERLLIGAMDAALILDRTFNTFFELPRPDAFVPVLTYGALIGRVVRGDAEVWAGESSGYLFRWRGSEPAQPVALPAPEGALSCPLVEGSLATPIQEVVLYGPYMIAIFGACDAVVFLDAERSCTFALRPSEGVGRPMARLDLHQDRWLTAATDQQVWELDVRQLVR